jgi:hypothetical protein
VLHQQGQHSDLQRDRNGGRGARRRDRQVQPARTGRCQLSVGSCSSARQSRGNLAHRFYEVLGELQALSAEGTTNEVIFEDLTLLLG